MLKIFLLAMGVAAILQVNGQFNIDEFKRLHLLTGTWKVIDKAGKLYEHWSVVDDSTMMGSTYRINKSDTAIEETMQLKWRNQQIVFAPVVQNQNDQQQVIFDLKMIRSDQYVFENLKHDFPQRIGYTLPANKFLAAYIEGKTAKGERHIDYIYQRVD